jgi:DNA invertase Pin-like site-specific DNA recombinase
MFIGYIRVSTNDQSTELQKMELNRLNCDLVFEDKMSGQTSERPGLKRAMRQLNAGDTLVVWKLDRLGRSVIDLINLLKEIQRRGAHFRSVTEGIDTSSAMGRFIYHIMSGLAEMERELIRERTLAGLAAARALGRIGGRPVKMTESYIEHARELLRNGATRKQVADIFNISTSTIYRLVPPQELAK